MHYSTEWKRLRAGMNQPWKVFFSSILTLGAERRLFAFFAPKGDESHLLFRGSQQNYFVF